MDKAEVDPWLASIGKDRRWLAGVCGYSYDYVRNSLAPGAPELSAKFAAAIERAVVEQERTRHGPKGSGVWDAVYFSATEVSTIDAARRAGGYRDMPQLYRDAVIDFADRLLAEQDRIKVAEDSPAYRGFEVTGGNPKNPGPQDPQ